MLLVIAVLVLASIGIMLLVRYPFGSVDTSGSGGNNQTQARISRPLTASDEAQFLTVIVYGEDGEMAAYMVGGKTEEFGSIRDAIAGATSSGGKPDDSYSDLLVFSFSDGTTMEIIYSPPANAIAYDGGIYQLDEDLVPVIKKVEERFSS